MAPAPLAGPFTIRFEMLAALAEPDQRLVICRVADAESRGALDGVLHGENEGLRPAWAGSRHAVATA